ncbi:hypothetical protein [Nocardia sp. NPDC049707]|uniref:hypothetical protein n=1 Tax=Nocardia sp. NPDC049707 TaxID=3154735 RepID=UPI003425E05C
MQPRAIGLLRLDVTDDRPRDEAVIGSLAHRLDCTLVGLVTIAPDTYMPTTLVVHTAHKVEAAVIVTPDRTHFAGAARSQYGVRSGDPGWDRDALQQSAVNPPA